MESEEKSVKFSGRYAQDSSGSCTIFQGKFSNIKMDLRSFVGETTISAVQNKNDVWMFTRCQIFSDLNINSGKFSNSKFSYFSRNLIHSSN